MKLSFKRISLSIFLLFLALAGYWLLRYYVWQPLDFDDYVEKLYWENVSEDPEGYTQLMPPTPLDPLLLPLTAQATDLHNLLNQPRSPQQMTQRAQTLLEGLIAYRKDALSPAQQLIYDQLEGHLLAEIEAAQYPYLHFPLNPVDGYPWPTLELLISTHPVFTTDEADAYLTRLRKLPMMIDQAIAVSNAYEKQQLIAPAAMWQRALDQLKTFIQVPANANPLYKQMAKKLGVSDPTAINEGEQVTYLIRTEKILEEQVYPALEELARHLEAQLAQAPKTAGIWQYPEGGTGYAFALRKYAGVSIAPDTAYEWGTRMVAAAQQQLAAGPQTAGNRRPVYDQPEDSLSVYLEDFSQRGDGLFADLQTALIQFSQADTTGFRSNTQYVAASRDGTREARLRFAPTDPLQPTCYRELLPGRHLLRSTLLANPRISNLILSLHEPAFEAGWAAYADELAKEYGFYQETERTQEYDERMRLDGALLVADVGIHHLQWERKQAIEYLDSLLTDLPPGQAAALADQCIAQPGYAIAAIAGKRKLLALRKRAGQEMGSNFQIREFHRAVMERGPLALPLLERSIDLYIRSFNKTE